MPGFLACSTTFLQWIPPFHSQISTSRVGHQLKGQSGLKTFYHYFLLLLSFLKPYVSEVRKKLGKTMIVVINM
ncbi:MAG: hypothetical protein EOO01_36340 [Chitinophagaceae bacterium]|nr:MAG: hypothetical protein EOO01_36340 [Chitinophagaceae bacterium]